MGRFADRVIDWQRTSGRHDLPWQLSRDPYGIWLAEVMLQQTQVATVIPYYRRFVQRFPDVHALAAAPVEDVMSAWAGLGYYSRARNLHRCAQHVVQKMNGAFPTAAAQWEQLPGVGRSTAAAIAAFAFGERAAIFDGNVRRVLARHFGMAGPRGDAQAERGFWTLAGSLLPDHDIGAYTQGLMDLGATVCLQRRPRCDACPLATSCVALRDERIAELPTPRAARTRPVRSTTVVIVRDANGAVLLETRPPAGIWGGLVSLPEFDAGLSDGDVVNAAAARYGVAVSLQDRLDELRHQFTHYTLVLRPRLAQLAAPRAVACADARFVSRAALDDTPLPAPIRRLLLAVCATG